MIELNYLEIEQKMVNELLNKIINIDCIDFMKNNILKNNIKIDNIITDIPYGVVNRKSAGIRNFDKKNADIVNFEIEELCNLFVKINPQNILIFCSTEQITDLYNGLKNDYFVKVGIWEKSNPSPVNGQHFWLSGVECCIVATKKEINDKELIWRFPNGRGKVHPTEKPLLLIEHLIEKFTKENDLVYDPFSGSGSHLEACFNKKRNFIGNEISEEYFNIIIKRINKKNGIC